MYTWFTGCTHFNHHNIIKNTNRPFKNTDEMNETMIDNWNDRVGEKDTVYHHGDFGWHYGDLSLILKRLKGKIILIKGNHDKKFLNKHLHYFDSVHTLLDIKLFDQKITLCHYAMRVWNCSHWNAWHLYSHSHGKLPSEGKSYDVGVDNNSFSPVSFGFINQIMKNKPNNINFIERK